MDSTKVALGGNSDNKVLTKSDGSSTSDCARGIFYVGKTIEESVKFDNYIKTVITPLIKKGVNHKLLAHVVGDDVNNHLREERKYNEEAQGIEGKNILHQGLSAYLLTTCGSGFNGYNVPSNVWRSRLTPRVNEDGSMTVTVTNLTLTSINKTDADTMSIVVALAKKDMNEMQDSFGFDPNTTPEAILTRANKGVEELKEGIKNDGLEDVNEGLNEQACGFLSPQLITYEVHLKLNEANELVESVDGFTYYGQHQPSYEKMLESTGNQEDCKKSSLYLDYVIEKYMKATGNEQDREKYKKIIEDYTYEFGNSQKGQIKEIFEKASAKYKYGHQKAAFESIKFYNPDLLVDFALSGYRAWGQTKVDGKAVEESEDGKNNAFHQMAMILNKIKPDSNLIEELKEKKSGDWDSVKSFLIDKIEKDSASRADIVSWIGKMESYTPNQMHSGHVLVCQSMDCNDKEKSIDFQDMEEREKKLTTKVSFVSMDFEGHVEQKCQIGDFQGGMSEYHTDNNEIISLTTDEYLVDDLLSDHVYAVLRDVLVYDLKIADNAKIADNTGTARTDGLKTEISKIEEINTSALDNSNISMIEDIFIKTNPADITGDNFLRAMLYYWTVFEDGRPKNDRGDHPEDLPPVQRTIENYIATRGVVAFANVVKSYEEKCKLNSSMSKLFAERIQTLPAYKRLGLNNPTNIFIKIFNALLTLFLKPLFILSRIVSKYDYNIGQKDIDNFKSTLCGGYLSPYSVDRMSVLEGPGGVPPKKIQEAMENEDLIQMLHKYDYKKLDQGVVRKGLELMETSELDVWAVSQGKLDIADLIGNNPSEDQKIKPTNLAKNSIEGYLSGRITVEARPVIELTRASISASEFDYKQPESRMSACTLKPINVMAHPFDPPYRLSPEQYNAVKDKLNSNSEDCVECTARINEKEERVFVPNEVFEEVVNKSLKPRK